MTTALDLFCGAGGASMGLWRSGLFDRIIGVDVENQPNYPFEFVEADALSVDITDFDPSFVWASPPCQHFVTLVDVDPHARTVQSDHPDLIGPTRELISEMDWYAIENVSGSSLRADITLEGGNVGYPNLKRRRVFEVSWSTVSPTPFTDGYVLHKVYGMGGTRDKRTVERRQALSLPKTATTSEICDLWRIDWDVSWQELTQMVPPRYATYVIFDAVAHGFVRDFPANPSTLAKELMGVR